MTPDERYRRTCEAAAADDARVNVDRAAAGLPPIRSIVLTPEQTTALRAGSLTLDEVLGRRSWLEDLLGVEFAPEPTTWAHRISPLRTGADRAQ